MKNRYNIKTTVALIACIGIAGLAVRFVHEVKLEFTNSWVELLVFVLLLCAFLLPVWYLAQKASRYDQIVQQQDKESNPPTVE